MTTQVPNSMLAYDGGSAFRNKIINGCGWIDQRNNNVAVTPFGTDRFTFTGTGFTNWNGWTGNGTLAATAEL